MDGTNEEEDDDQELDDGEVVHPDHHDSPTQGCGRSSAAAPHEARLGEAGRIQPPSPRHYPCCFAQKPADQVVRIVLQWVVQVQVQVRRATSPLLQQRSQGQCLPATRSLGRTPAAPCGRKPLPCRGRVPCLAWWLSASRLSSVPGFSARGSSPMLRSPRLQPAALELV